MNRRRLLLATAAAPGGTWFAPAAAATPASMRAAIAEFTRGAAVHASGRVTLEIAPLVENGNTVPVTVRVASPMTAADHVQRIALFTERNPEPGVAVFHLGPRNGRAEVSTRMRLATSQTVTALALLSDGSVHGQTLDVLVTLAACVEP